MTKRPRLEECEVVWLLNSTHPSIETDPGNRPESNKEGGLRSVVSGGHSVCGKEAAESPQLVSAKVACANEDRAEVVFDKRACVDMACANVARAEVSLTGCGNTQTPKYPY